MGQEGGDIALVAQTELIEERAVEARCETAGSEQPVVELVGTVAGELGGLAQALLAHEAHVDGHP